MEEHAILPAELITVLAVMLGPPLALAIFGQWLFFSRRRLFQRSLVRAAGSLIGTAVVSATILVSLVLFSSAPLPRWLAVQDVSLGKFWLPVLPLAYIVVAIVATGLSWCAVRKDGPA